jgi:hypothetical protein
VHLVINISSFQLPCQEDGDNDTNTNNRGASAGASGEAFPYMSMFVLRLHGKRLEHKLYAKDVVSSTGSFKNSRDLSLEMTLASTDECFANSSTSSPSQTSGLTVFPCLYPAGREAGFRITVHCSVPVSLAALVDDVVASEYV